MKFPSRGEKGQRRRFGGPGWMPSPPSEGLTPEQERLLEGDDLEELLKATNAKRAARGKSPLSTSDVELRVWSVEQEMQRSTPPIQEEPDPLDDWADGTR